MAKSKDKEKNKYIIKEIGQKAWFPWVRDALGDWAIITGTFLMLAYNIHNPFILIIAILIIGNRQHALALLGHDGTHYTIHKNPYINDAISDLLSWGALGLTTSGYRNVHFRHHTHLNTEHDPELMHRSSKSPQWDLPITKGKILRYALMDLIGYSVTDYFMIAYHAVPSSPLIRYRMIATNIFVTSLFIYFGYYWVPLIWYVSLVTSFMMFFRIRTWLEHQGSDDTHKLKLSYLESVIFSPHESWYHHEHHTFPNVPYHKLHLVRETLQDEQEPPITMTELFESYKNMPSLPSGIALKKVQA